MTPQTAVSCTRIPRDPPTTPTPTSDLTQNAVPRVSLTRGQRGGCRWHGCRTGGRRRVLGTVSRWLSAARVPENGKLPPAGARTPQPCAGHVGSLGQLTMSDPGEPEMRGDRLGCRSPAAGGLGGPFPEPGDSAEVQASLSQSPGSIPGFRLSPRPVPSPALHR